MTPLLHAGRSYCLGLLILLRVRGGDHAEQGASSMTRVRLAPLFGAVPLVAVSLCDCVKERDDTPDQTLSVFVTPVPDGPGHGSVAPAWLTCHHALHHRERRSLASPRSCLARRPG